ncbi:MAG: FAD-dependent oxidoreductase [Nibricoccus sp.]
MKYDVVIAGGGFAGAYCAQVLGKALGAAGVKRVALIAERNVLVFHPMLAEVAGAALSPLDVVNPLRQFCRNVDVLQGAIQRVDWAKKQLVLDGGRFTRNHVVAFDHLVLTLGSVTDMSRVPGMADHAWPMKNVADALRLRAALINRLEEANLVEDVELKQRLMTFVVVGGGYTGVETAGQIMDLLHEVRSLYANLRDTKPRIILVHSRAHLLEEIGPKLGDYAQRVLEKRGMEMRLNTRVTEVTASKVILQDGGFIEAHTVVCTVGNAPSPVVLDLAKQLGLAADKGRIGVEPTMQVKGVDKLWASGDCAAVPWDDKGEAKIAPPTAQFAMRQGKQLGRNLARVLKGGANAELRPFSYRYMGQLATVGEREAVAEVFGMHFSGFIAWWMWRTIYLAKLPGMMRRLRVTIDWTFDLFFQRDISLVLPPPEDILRAIHLEKGESLFEAGGKVRAFFYVKRGAVELRATGDSVQTLPAGTVIDQAYANGDGVWHAGASAVESTDVVVIRGRALEMLKTELKLVRR